MRFCECLKIPGLPYAGACAKVGISERVFQDWMLRGEVEPESLYGKFREAVEQARMEGLYNGHKEVATVDVKWLLERRFPEIYGTPKQKLEVTGQDGGPVKIEAGIQVIVESSDPGSKESSLTVFVDERPGSPWFGLPGLLLDSQGYIFDASGKLLGVLRDLPQPEIAGRNGAAATSPAPEPAPTRIDPRDPLGARGRA